VALAEQGVEAHRVALIEAGHPTVAAAAGRLAAAPGPAKLLQARYLLDLALRA